MPNRIIFTDKKIGNGTRKGSGFIGMNYPASKKLKIPHKGKNVFYIYDDGNKKRIENTIRHEEIEDYLLNRGWDYKKKRKVSAHDVGNELEGNTNLIVKVRGSNRNRGYIRQL